MDPKKIIGKLLLAFVLVSVGFAIGKETAKAPAASGLAAESATAGESKVVVYYFHSTFRCPTCNQIESLGSEIVSTEFADAVKAGRLEWKPMDYLQNSDMAERYKVGKNLIMVVRFKDGREVAATRLDQVMELANDREAFMQYVRQAIQKSLKEAA